MDPQELLLTAGRALLVYVVMLIAMRALGKRSVGSFSAFDLLVALMLGEVVDEIIYGDVSIAQGMVVIGTVVLLEMGVEWLSYKNAGSQAVLEGTPVILIRDGELQPEAMSRERLNERDVMALLRLSGQDDLREVKWGVLETNGQMSVILHDWAEPLQKADLGGEDAEEREAVFAGRNEPPPDQTATDPRYLPMEA